MFSRRSASAYGASFKRKHFFQMALLAVVILAFLFLLPVAYFRLRGRSGNERREIQNLFESGSFEDAYARSGEMLTERPLDYFLLTIHGFSAYQLAVAQINNFDTLSYIDRCIWSLRKALLSRESPSDPKIRLANASPASADGRVFYVLGKAYYYKGSGYADLAVHYLEKASDPKSFGQGPRQSPADIPEYLGLAYAAIRDYRSSVAAFTLALQGEESGASSGSPDVLLVSIARSYLALGEHESARAYLVRCLETSRDSRTIAAARLLLGGILLKAGNVSGAEAEYLKVIEEDDENAEAHFQLGELYAFGGDTTRARAEWRRAVRIDPAHGPARSRLNS